MSRLNLICNGMMLFNELDEDQIQIVIPSIDGHVRQFCAAPIPAKSNLQPLNTGSYALAGPQSSGLPSVELFDTDGCIVLSNEVVDFDEDAAAQVSSIIIVPKPDVIRLFRGCEPMTDVVQSSGSAVVSAPVILNDIAVLSYRNIPANTALSLASESGSVLASAETTGDSAEAVNWIFYSNEIAAPALGDQHDTTLNGFLTIDGHPTDFVLSGFGSQDAGYDTAIGMKVYHMAMFQELPDTVEQAEKMGLISGPAGCSYLVVADPPQD